MFGTQTAEFALRLYPELLAHFCPGAPVYTLENANPLRGLANGTTAELYALTWSTDEKRQRALEWLQSNPGDVLLPEGLEPEHVLVRPRLSDELKESWPRNLNLVDTSSIDHMAGEGRRQILDVVVPVEVSPETIVLNPGSGRAHNPVTVVVEKQMCDLAFVCTVHKAQGATWDRVIVSLLNRPGTPSRNDYHAVYVALSRVRDGNHLRVLANSVDDLAFVDDLRPPLELLAFLDGYDEATGLWDGIRAHASLARRKAAATASVPSERGRRGRQPGRGGAGGGRARSVPNSPSGAGRAARSARSSSTAGRAGRVARSPSVPRRGRQNSAITGSSTHGAGGNAATTPVRSTARAGASTSALGIGRGLGHRSVLARAGIPLAVQGNVRTAAEASAIVNAGLAAVHHFMPLRYALDNAHADEYPSDATYHFPAITAATPLRFDFDVRRVLHSNVFVPILTAAFNIAADAERIGYFRDHVFGPLFWDETIEKLQLLIEAFGIQGVHWEYTNGHHYTPEGVQLYLLDLDEHLRNACGAIGGLNILRIRIEAVYVAQQTVLHGHGLLRLLG